MCFKNPLCQVLCLIITVILYPAATAECDTNALEALISYKFEKLQQHIIENMKQGKTDGTGVKEEKTGDAQHEEVIEKLAALATNVQQMAESIKNLQNISDNLVANQSHVEKQLKNVENELFEQGNRIDNVSSSCTTLKINRTGTYYIRPAGVVEPFLVLCDFDDNYNLGGGWTVFQHRFNGTVDFNQNWTMYKNGFGDMKGEHWLGLEKLHVMTRSARHEMLVLLEDHEGGSAYALYDSFRIDSEAEKYKLTVGSYSGTAGDSLDFHNGVKFSTFDQDNDKYSKNCAKRYNGAWWFDDCYHSHLNGKYFQKGEHRKRSFSWFHWKGSGYSLKSSKMMLRRSGANKII